MKPGLAVLPLEVWADIFLSPWFTRQKLAQILNGTRNRNFANKLDKLLHGCGQQTMGFLRISSELKKNSWKYQLQKCKNRKWEICKISKRQATLSIKKSRYGSTIKDCEFPKTEMPDNIKQFKGIEICYLDDQVMDFLTKIKPLFANVILYIDSIEYELAKDIRILLTHLLPMIGSIRGIECDNKCIGFLERHFPGTLARAKELHLFAQPASIPAFLDWLSAPQDFAVHGPRFLEVEAKSKTINAIVDAVRKQFLAATMPSTFVILLELDHFEPHGSIDEFKFKLENAATKEGLIVRNAMFKDNDGDYIHYVEIIRHPADAEAIMREWIEKRAYFEKAYNDDDGDEADQQTIMMGWSPVRIGHITKKAKAIEQGNETDG